MADMLAIGSSALLAYQQQLATTSHNVANANTPGYSRQTVELQSVGGTPTGNGTFGSGVSAVTVTRAQNPFDQSQLLTATAASSSADVVASTATQIDASFSAANLTLATPLNSWFDALDAWASAPTDAASRQAVLDSANTLATQWASTDSSLTQLQQGLTQQAQTAVGQINTLTTQIAKLNNAIKLATGSGGGNPPNDLLDQRDQAINQLAAQIGVNLVTDNAGMANVYTSSGEALVLGVNATSVSLGTNPDSGNPRLQLGSGASQVNLTSVSGGALGGALTALTQNVIPAQESLAQLANRLAAAVNSVQSAGTDLNGNAGQPLLSVTPPSVQPAAGNSGTASLTASMSDPVSWPAEPVQLSFDGSSWTAVGTRTGTSYPVSGSGTAASPLSFAGLSVVTSGSAAAGDRYTIDDRSSGLAVSLSSASQLASANPVTVSPASSNTGSASVAQLKVTDPSNSQLRSPVTVSFTSPTQVSINGAPPVAFNGSISANGWTLSLTGTPNAGDSFSLAPTGANSADNGIANQLAGLRTASGSDQQSIVQAQSSLISSTGSQAARAQGLQQAQSTLQSQAQDAVDQVSGVSLDQEAADLVRFQQAYQAAAQIISSAQTIFNSLLHAAGGV